MKYLKYIFYTLLFFSCTNKHEKHENQINISKYELNILKDTIAINDSIEIKFSSSYNDYYLVRSNVLNEIISINTIDNSIDNSIDSNSLNIIFTNDKGEILNEYSMTNIDADLNNNSLKKINNPCSRENIIEFVLNKDKVLKLKMIDINTLKNIIGS
ncbi:hypothetical protein, partial [Empedobacter brevis]|uniref:hypothetical protein n=1 Tax=Empedobacter brevis TaxID=247 RepID=UPI0039B0A5AA